MDDTWYESSPDNDSVASILTAIARSQFPVAHLDVANKHSKRPCEPEAFHSIHAARTFPWAHLSYLKTTINSSNLQAYSSQWTAFQTWLSSLRALNHLDIAFETPKPHTFGYDIDVWPRMVFLPPWKRLAECLEHTASLSKLRIGRGRFGKEGVLHILESLATRLRSLSIESCCIVGDQGVWIDVLAWIADHLVLDQISTSSLSNERGKIVTASGDDRFTIEGDPEIVKSQLLKHVRAYASQMTLQVTGENGAGLVGGGLRSRLWSTTSWTPRS
ncbi:hypothetical protein B0A48_00991 [Cryoendolithus antarcticus]|uniref:F-box domain-containing protein n=1 Tax=Cryoendolithus antarcticus TaxID=1507870 RepID=A0A1V8TRX7_9PEZI|nr:hypothetical protein B0A48_00991 [Cryoendolithus antarcticus]